jgi:hypothetical protein
METASRPPHNINHTEREQPKQVYNLSIKGGCGYIVAKSLIEASLLSLLSTKAYEQYQNNIYGLLGIKSFMASPQAEQLNYLSELAEILGFANGEIIVSDSILDNLTINFPTPVFFNQTGKGVLYPKSKDVSAAIFTTPENIEQEWGFSTIQIDKVLTVQVTAGVNLWATLPYQILGFTEANKLPELQKKLKVFKGMSEARYVKPNI